MPERENITIGVAAVVYQGPFILIGRRSMKKKICPGLWQFPGGHVDLEEEIDRTAVREVMEETGLDVIVPSYDGEKPPYLFVTDQRPVIANLTFWVPAEVIGGHLENTEPDACDGWQWIKPSEVPLFVPNVYHMPQISWMPLDLLNKYAWPGSPFGGQHARQNQTVVAGSYGLLAHLRHEVRADSTPQRPTVSRPLDHLPLPLVQHLAP